ncbi:MAG: hypothetical protein Q7K45_00195 [Nanoarchaeota archaeon]|nr:hypothetical protein [Nanoarchaeota archaeon]
MMEPLLSEHYLRTVFGATFWNSTSWTKFPLHSLALGLEQVIESQGAVINNATALLLNNTFSQGRIHTKQKYLGLIRRQKLEEYLPNISWQPLAETLHQAFRLPENYKARIASQYAPHFFAQSQVLYSDSERKEKFILSHFKLKNHLDSISYFVPQFRIEGLL